MGDYKEKKKKSKRAKKRVHNEMADNHVVTTGKMENENAVEKNAEHAARPKEGPQQKKSRVEGNRSDVRDMTQVKEEMAQKMMQLSQTAPIEVQTATSIASSMLALFDDANAKLVGNNKKMTNKLHKIALKNMIAGLFTSMRPAFSAVLTQLLSQHEIPLATIEKVSEHQLFGEHTVTANVQLARIYFITSLVNARTLPLEVVDKYLEKLVAICHEKDMEDIAKSSLLSCVEKALSNDSIEKSDKKKLFSHVVKVLKNRDIEKYSLADFVIALRISQSPELCSKETVHTRRNLLLSGRLIRLLCEYQKRRAYFGRHELWESILEELVKEQNVEKASQLWFDISKGIFSLRNTENDRTMALVAVGFDIFRIALQSFPNQYVEFMFTESFMWHLSFALQVNKTITKDQAEFGVKRSKNQSGYGELVNRPSVLKYAELSDAAVWAIRSISANDADMACSMLVSISKNKNIHEYAHIPRLIKSIYQPHATSASVLKWTLKNWSMIKNTNLHPLTSVPGVLSELKTMQTDKLLDYLKVLFFHSCYTIANGEEDEMSQLHADERESFRERFFDILNQIAKEELAYYESDDKSTLVFPWSEHLYSFVKKELEGKKNTKSRFDRTQEAMEVQKILEKVEKQLNKIMKQLVQLGSKDLRVAAFRILVQRCLLYVIADPEFMDADTAKDIAQFVDVMYLKKKMTMPSTDGDDEDDDEEETSTIAVMTDVFIFLLSRTNHLDELIKFLFVQYKYDMDNQGLALLTDTIQNILVEETDNKLDEDEEEEDEEGSDDEDSEMDQDSNMNDATDNDNMVDEDNMEDSYITDADMFAQDGVLTELIKEKMKALRNPGMSFKNFGVRLTGILGMLYKYKPKAAKSSSAIEKNKRCKMLIYVNLVHMLLRLQSIKIAVELSSLLQEVYAVVQRTESQGSIATLTAEKFDSRTRFNMDAAEKKEIAANATDFLTEDDLSTLTELLKSVVNSILSVDVKQRQPFVETFIFLLSVLYYQNSDKVREIVVQQYFDWILKEKPGHLESEKPPLYTVSQRLPFIYADIVPLVLQSFKEEKLPLKHQYVLVSGILIPSLEKPNLSYNIEQQFNQDNYIEYLDAAVQFHDLVIRHIVMQWEKLTNSTAAIEGDNTKSKGRANGIASPKKERKDTEEDQDQQQQAHIIVHTNWLVSSCSFISRVFQRLELQKYSVDAEKLVQVFKQLHANTQPESKLQSTLRTVKEASGGSKHGTGAVQKATHRLEKALNHFKKFISREHENENTIDRLSPNKKARSQSRK